jgi:hypothetical protein
MPNSFTIARAFRDPRLFGAALEDLSSWQVWLTLLCAAFALPLTAEQLQTFAQISGGRLPPSKLVRELWCVCGRRSGKSRIAALIAVFIALFVKHRASPGERPMVLVIAGSVDQADTVFNYIRGFVECSAALSKEVASFKRREVVLRNGVVIAVHANSFRTVRGRTLVAAVFDEVSFWRDETTASPDTEVYRAVLPALARPNGINGMLIGISTPYRKMGLLHQKWRDHFAKDIADTLVVQGSSKTFNPSLSDATIAAQREADPQGAVAEWDAQFRDDLASFLDDASIDVAIDHGRSAELPPRENVVYFAFVDMAGGGADASTLCICHRDGERFVVDVIRGRRGDPHAATLEFAGLAKQYRCATVTGDNYAKEWVAGAYRAAGREYRRAPLVRSDLYLEGQVHFTRGLVSIPDHATLIREYRLLERRTARSGRDSVNHGVGGHDDHANALFGALYVAAKAAVADDTPIVQPFIATRPRYIPGSDYHRGDVTVSANSPHRPSFTEPWAPYVGLSGVRRDPWSADW